MLEQILSPENLNAAYLKVAQNKGACGADGMIAEELPDFLEAQGENIRQSIFLRMHLGIPSKSTFYRQLQAEAAAIPER